MPLTRGWVFLGSAVVLVGAGAAQLGGRGASGEGPAASGGPGGVAVGVDLDGEAGLLGAVVVPAQAVHVRAVGGAERPGDPVVLVGAGGGLAAAGEGARRVAGFEVALQAWGGDVAVAGGVGVQSGAEQRRPPHVGLLPV